MNKQRHLPLLLLLLLLLVASCQRIPVGYLHTQNAEFVPRVMKVYHTPSPSTPRATNGAPWVSTRIQGVAGTNPINYAYESVKASNGGDASRFQQVVQEGELVVDGGLIRLSQKGAKSLPFGQYTLTLRVYNEGYSVTLADIITIVVADQEPDNL